MDGFLYHSCMYLTFVTLYVCKRQISPNIVYCTHICVGATQSSLSSLGRPNILYAVFWVMYFFLIYNPFPTDKTLLASCC